MATCTIIHADLDAFFVSVEQVFQPELKGKPVVVGGKPDRRGVVAAASYEARAFGLHSGMPLATAVRLCPQAIFIEGNFHRYLDASKKFMAILADFSPFIEPGGLDEAYLDVTGFESLHGTIRQMALAIKQRVKNELGLAVFNRHRSLQSSRQSSLGLLQTGRPDRSTCRDRKPLFLRRSPSVSCQASVRRQNRFYEVLVSKP